MKGHHAAKLRRNSARKVKGAETTKTISECGDAGWVDRRMLNRSPEASKKPLPEQAAVSDKRHHKVRVIACLVASYALAVHVHGKAYVSNSSDSVRNPPHPFIQTAPFMR
jgi:hypothetical protein